MSQDPAVVEFLRTAYRPTVEVKCVMRDSRGQEFNGSIIVSRASPVHPGPEHPIEMFNSGKRFIPFRHADKDDLDIVNKKLTVWVFIPRPEMETLGVEDPDPEMTPMHQVRVVFATGDVHLGIMALDDNTPAPRVSDLLNSGKEFYQIQVEEGTLVFNADYVQMVKDLGKMKLDLF
ncbi:MAG: hypothetical protein GMKNLPBB_00338 [Myxococcota bacterium]|nr:hypothetical protein [Myxococcota bacterium]